MKAKTLISLADGVISNPLRQLPAPASFELCEGECIAIVGPNGCGKSTLLEMIRGGFYLREGTLRHDLRDESYRAIRTVEFDNAYSTTETQYYYQQRWQAFEREASPLAAELLEAEESEWREQLFELLNIRPLLSKEIITLSSGELRRFSIARAMLQQPQVLILESPYIGLDPPTRKLLSDLLLLVRTQLGVSVIMTLPAPDQIPQVVTHVYFMKDGVVSEKIPAETIYSPGQSLRLKEVLPDSRSVPSLLNAGRTRFHASVNSAREKASNTDVLPELPQLHYTPLFDKVVEMRHVDISYGERQIFRDLNWTVRSGEKWNVTGPNGSGKSTLLSLVNADNPRAYSLDITLFDRKRGTGESIWDIKRHIGFLSSEMHSGFITSETVLEIVRSGLGHNGDGRISAEYMKGFATGVSEGGDRLNVREKNLHTRCTPVADEDAYLMRWLELFGAEDLAQRNYNTLSSGEQRYILLIRAFVKDPDLLILDEPFQGLDQQKRHRAGAVIESFCRRPNKTLIFVTHYIEEIPGVVTHTLQL